MPEPTALADHQADYHPKAWEQYTLAELGQWVHLFAKRAAHRANVEKAEKDLYDAQNYLDMMQATIKELRDQILKTN